MKYLITSATEQTATHTGPDGLVIVHSMPDTAIVRGPRQAVTSLAGYTAIVAPTPPVTLASIEAERKAALAAGCEVNGVTYAINDDAQLAWTTGVAAIGNLLDIGAIKPTDKLPFTINDATGKTIDGLTVRQFQQLMAQLTVAIGTINATAASKALTF